MCVNQNGNGKLVFGKIINNTQHLLYCLLPPQREQHYELRQRVHNFQLPARSSSLLDSNYFMWMLFKNTQDVRYQQLLFYDILSLH